MKGTICTILLDWICELLFSIFFSFKINKDLDIVDKIFCY